MRINPTTRFFNNINKTSSCWLWIKARTRAGYGEFFVNGKMAYAHRFSWELHKGPIPIGQCVLHNCPGGDNPACVNPDHLFLGTKLDNNRDMLKKGTFSMGIKHTFAKLTVQDVLWIKENMKRPCKGINAIAKRFGVCRQSIYQIIDGKTWKSIHA
jgi:hypothetical protein